MNNKRNFLKTVAAVGFVAMGMGSAMAAAMNRVRVSGMNGSLQKTHWRNSLC